MWYVLYQKRNLVYYNFLYGWAILFCWKIKNYEKNLRNLNFSYGKGKVLHTLKHFVYNYKLSSLQH